VSEGSVKHVEVFQMGSVRTPIIGGPRPTPGSTRRYTLNCEEPQILGGELDDARIRLVVSR
ncbi:hypothetical protein, partial [Pseudactinotalea terrae]|uniref:hypothetical protein n=1 Tax=Pseudactinotalea terrae TaxID=1743262 RepID=UPI0019D55B1B